MRVTSLKRNRVWRIDGDHLAFEILDGLDRVLKIRPQHDEVIDRARCRVVSALDR